MLKRNLKQLLLLGLEWVTERLLWWLMALEPRPPRKQCLDYHVSLTLPEHILAIIRVSWYNNGRPECVNEVVLLEDDETALEAFAYVVGTSMEQGANVSIRSAYQPEELGILS
jgi:hypothetical protein